MEARRLLDQGARDQMPYAAPHHPLATNGFKINLPESVEVIVREMPSPSEVKGERERLGEYWFVHWMGGKLYNLRLKGGGPNVDGSPRTLRTSQHPWLLRSRLDDAIGEALPKYEPIRERPFTFLAQKSELIKKAAAATNSRLEDRQRYVGITTVFSGDGTYLLGNVSKECTYDAYADMIKVSTLSIIKELKTRNNWQPGDTVRVIFHAHRPLKRIDVGQIVFACAKEIGAEQDTLICLIYDPEHRCSNPATLENDLANSGSRLRVRAVVCPQGL